MWKFKSWKGKDKWLFLLIIGVIFCILAFPADKLSQKTFADGKTGHMAEDRTGDLAAKTSGTKGADSAMAGAMDLAAGDSLQKDAVMAAADVKDSYEAELERRVKEILKNVDGVGQVDVMIVLKSSSEKVVHVDGSSSRSMTEEQDGSGGTRRIESEEQGQSTIMMSNGGGNMPIIEKELRPEISGIIISAEGGGKLSVKAEISAAMEALFGLPAHKIKVLKRVE